jgi:hypothetical protein
MSKRTLRLAGLTFIALTLMVLGTAFAPPAQADCNDVVVYATNPATGECIQTNPCDVPPGWTVTTDGCHS